MDNFDSYNVLLADSTNIPVLLMTAFVLQGHIVIKIYIKKEAIVSSFRTIFNRKSKHFIKFNIKSFNTI